MKIGIVIATYRRKDGRTSAYLRKALKSIKNQFYQDYKVFLIGDNYESNCEFLKLATTIIDSDKIYYENLPIAKERSKYPIGDFRLWCAGGVNAMNYGIQKCLSEGINYICHLDHDDWWKNNHLEEINKKIKENYFFIATKSTYRYYTVLPRNSSNPFYPSFADLVNSSTCIKFSDCDLRYRDVFSEEGRYYVADGDLWERLKVFMKNNNKKGVLINKITCHHDAENEPDKERELGHLLFYIDSALRNFSARSSFIFLLFWRLYRKLLWYARRTCVRRKLKGQTHLHLGCGYNIIDGWANIDLNGKKGVISWDLTCGLPVPSGSIEFIYSEHFIEHITLVQAVQLISECYRVLRPGGVMRLSTPSLKKVVDEYLLGRTTEWLDVGLSSATPCRLVNEIFRQDGHQFIYDADELKHVFESAGYSQVIQVAWHESVIPALRKLECRPFHGEIIFEAIK